MELLLNFNLVKRKFEMLLSFVDVYLLSNGIVHTFGLLGELRANWWSWP